MESSCFETVAEAVEFINEVNPSSTSWQDAVEKRTNGLDTIESALMIRTSHTKDEIRGRVEDNIRKTLRLQKKEENKEEHEMTPNMPREAETRRDTNGQIVLEEVDLV